MKITLIVAACIFMFLGVSMVGILSMLPSKNAIEFPHATDAELRAAYAKPANQDAINLVQMKSIP